MDLQQYIRRNELLDAVRQGLSEAPVVALLGTRQVGKTTLAQEVASNWPGATTVFDLEVAAVREALSQTPETTLREREGLVVIDEVQRLPTLFETLRPICDDRSRRAVYLLLGSASWDLIQGGIRDARWSRAVCRRGRARTVGNWNRASEPAVDARRISTRMASTFGGRMDTLDGILRANLPRT